MTDQDFILQHREDDVRKLAFCRAGADINLSYCLQQIEGWQTARKKLPLWASSDGVVFPPRLSMEQCSSQATAEYKREVMERLLPTCRQKMMDLTGGFGVDFSYLSQGFDEAVYVEQQEHLCQIARHNFPLLGMRNARVLCARGEDVLTEESPCSFIYLDPARRDVSGRKVVLLEDCTPNVTTLYNILVDAAAWVMIKLSPMLDISQALRSLPLVREVHVVSVQNECKELLLLLSRTEVPLTFHCINIADEVQRLVVGAGEGKPVVADDVQTYLYEPNASILKAGVQDALCQSMGVQKLHPFSHLFTSEEQITNFPGRRFVVEAQSDFGKQGLKQLLAGMTKANLAIRNFPSTVAELRKKLKLKEGGDDYLFATTLKEGRHALIRCKKA